LFRELTSSLVNTLPRCHSTVRGLMNSSAPISEFVLPAAASRAIWVSCAVSASRTSAVRWRTVSPVASSTAVARVGERPDEARHVAGSRGVPEGFQEAVSMGRIDRIVPLPGEADACSSRQLPRIGLTEFEHAGDVAERIVEGLAEHVHGPLDGRKPGEQEMNRQPEFLPAFRLHRRVGGRVVAFPPPHAGTDLADDTGRGHRVDGHPPRDGHQKRDPIAYLGPVRPLPADPHVLDDVLGVGCPAQHPVGDPEQPGTDALEVGQQRIGHAHGNHPAHGGLDRGTRRDDQATVPRPGRQPRP
jgi:hypothetical protein